MTGFAALHRFAAELTLFLISVSGVALVGIRASLLARARIAASAMSLGFLLLAATAFLRGSALAGAAGSDDLVVAARVAGSGLVAAAVALRWAATRGSRNLALAGLTSVAMVGLLGRGVGSAWESLLVGAGALAIGAALAWASRRAIAARVLTGSAATLLVVVLVVSLGSSAVLSANVERQEMRNLDDRSRLEVARLEDTRRAVTERASTRAAALAAEPGAAAWLASTDAGGLDAFLRSEPVFPRSAGASGLAFVAADGTVRAAAGAASTPGAASLLTGSAAVSTTLGERSSEGSFVAGPDGSALAVGAASVVLRTGDGEMVAGAVVAVTSVDTAYLRVATADDADLSLALVFDRRLLVAAGAQPPPSSIDRLADAARRDGAQLVETGGRFTAARPVGDGSSPDGMVLVASAPTAVVDAVRGDLFLTFFVIALGGTMLALLLATVLGSGIGRRLERLTAVADEIRLGRRGARAPVESEDEVGVLGEAFDSMVTALQSQTDALGRAADDEHRLRSRLEAIVAGMEESVVATDGDGMVTQVNRAAEELLGSARSELVSRPIREVLRVRTSSRDGAFDHLPAGEGWGAEAGDSQGEEVMLAVDGGGEVPVTISVGRLRSPSGGPAGAVYVLRDVRPQHEVARMKREFLSRIGHELRTPLTPLLGISRLLSSRPVTADAAHDLYDTMHLSAQRLLRVVEMLEFFASLDGGSDALRNQPVDVQEVVRLAFARRAATQEAAGRLRCEAGSSTPSAEADERWLARSVDELIDNALKFSPADGQILVSCGPVYIDGALWAEIAVEDEGPGMPPEQVSGLRGEWAQGDSSDTRRHGGLGLGLALVQRVAEHHGGRLVIGPRRHQGARVTIVLPALPGRPC